MRNLLARLAIGVCVLAVAFTTACQSGEPPAATDRPAPETGQEEPPPQPDPTQADPTQPDPTPAEDGSADQWVMPDLVGQNLQDAQDLIQALTGGALLITLSHDLSGQDRNQVLDANWTVCTQNVPAGSPITADSEIDFGAVKVDENCP